MPLNINVHNTGYHGKNSLKLHFVFVFLAPQLVPQLLITNAQMYKVLFLQQN